MNNTHEISSLCAGAVPAAAATETQAASSAPSPEAAPLAADQPVEAEEGRDIGHVKWPVYVAYMKAVGTGLVAFVFLSITLMQVHLCTFHVYCTVCALFFYDVLLIRAESSQAQKVYTLCISCQGYTVPALERICMAVADKA